MKRTLIRYRTKPDRTDENEALIKAVFGELHQKSPEGIRYLSLKLGDGSFVHFFANEADDQPSILPTLKAFAAFQNGITRPLHRTAAIGRRDDRRQLSDAER